MQLRHRQASSLGCSTSARRSSYVAPAKLRLVSIPRPVSRVTLRSSVTQEQATSVTPANPISLTENALNHLIKLRADVGGDTLLLRVGVKQGGCSGLSYIMDFEKPENITEDDMVMEYENGKFKMVCDPKSLLYLFGMNMDYSTALVGGGFKFTNPNASDSCGCGKSFGV